MSAQYPYIRFTLSEHAFKVRRNLLVWAGLLLLALLGGIESQIKMNQFGIAIELSRENIFSLLYLAVVFQSTYFIVLTTNEFNRFYSKRNDQGELVAYRQHIWIIHPDFRNYLKKIGFFEVVVPYLLKFRGSFGRKTSNNMLNY